MPSKTSADFRNARVTRKVDNKITRVIIPFLYDNPGATINDVIDPNTGKPVEALYFYDALKAGIIEQKTDVVRTGKRGRPAKMWKLTKATRDRVTKQRKRAAAKAAEASVEATPEPALV